MEQRCNMILELEMKMSPSNWLLFPALASHLVKLYISTYSFQNLMIVKGVMNSHLPDLEAGTERDGLQKSSSCTIKTSFPTPETSQCGTPEDIAWSFGCLNGHIFHQDSDKSDPNLSCFNSIPPKLQFIYKRCLAKNPLKRPSIQVLRDLLSSVQEFNKLSVIN